MTDVTEPQAASAGRCARTPRRRGAPGRSRSRTARPALTALAALLLVLSLPPSVGSALAQDLSADRVDTARAAVRAADRRDYRLAEAQAVAAGSALLRKYILWRKLSDPNGPRADFTSYANLIRDGGDWPRLSVLQARAEDTLGDELGDRDMVHWFDASPPVSGTGRLRLAEALLRLGEKEKGAAVLRDAWINADFDPATERDIRRRHAAILTDADHRARLERLLAERRASSAQRMLPLMPNDIEALGQARIKLINLSSGVDRAISRVPSHLMENPGLVHDRAVWRRKKGRQDEALEMLASFPAPSGIARSLWDERAIAARYGLANGAAPLAYAVASGHGLDAGEDYAEAEFLSGWIALRYLNDPARAASHFEKLFAAVRYPISRARGAYWAGRAAAASGADAGAVDWYRRAAEESVTYYGQLAALELNRRGIETSLRFDEPPAPTSDEKRAFYAREPVRIVRLLSALSFDENTDPFIRDMSRRATSPSEHLLVSEVAEEIERPDLSVRAARDAILNGVISLRYGFPTSIARRLGGLENLPGPEGVQPALLLAIMRQESGFKTAAESGAGARGLMQLMPATARLVARQQGVGFSRDKLFSDPVYNVSLGRAYLADMLARFDGAIFMAAAAYNAGPNRVSGWIGRHGDPRTGAIDAIDWIELIPFSETRNYVQRIMENLVVYRHAMGDSQALQHLADDLYLGVRRESPARREEKGAKLAPNAGPRPYPGPELAMTPR